MATCFVTPITTSLNVLKRYTYLRRACNLNMIFLRQLSEMKGLVLGVYTESSKDNKDILSCTKAFEDIDKKCDGKLLKILKSTGPFQESTNLKVFWVSALKEAGVKVDFDCIAVVNLGSKDSEVNDLEDRDEKAETVRCSIADGISALQGTSTFDDIYLDTCDNPRCVGEAASLTLFSYDELKQESSRKPKPNVYAYEHKNLSSDAMAEYKKGVIYGDCQNFARKLMETPANYMTPSIFSSTVQAKLKGSKVEVMIRDKSWAESQKMGSYLSVARGSFEEPKFLELHYNGTDDDKCIALVGKGITFDSGGISLKPPAKMDLMRADMGGAACVVGTVLGASLLDLKINIKAYMPLTENMPGGKSTKPGDVVVAMNGKTIQVDNTDAEGRLVLCDALTYAQQSKPTAILDFATLTGGMVVALGAACAGAFSNNTNLWKLFHEAGQTSGDRVWRLPLFKHYTKSMTKCQTADLNNIGSSNAGQCCTAAAFLKEFIEPGTKWMHVDIAGVMTLENYKAPYLCKEMSGRPTRTIIQFLENLSKKPSSLESLHAK